MTESIQRQIASMCVSPTASIREAMAAIDRGALGLALLIDPESQVFSGLVTDGDLRRALLDGLGLSNSVAEVKRPAARTARAGTSIEELVSVFAGAIRALPLLDDEGRVVDIAVFDSRARLPVAEPVFGERELFYVTECVLTGWVSSAGSFVTRFENMFAEFCGAEYAVAVCNGTAALHLALVALGIGPGDEVIVPSLTFIATANAVAFTGATPVLVDSEAETWNIDPELIRSAITPRTKAILPVHLYGHPADLDPILALAAEHGIPVIEDAAEAHGALYKGRPVGGIGHMGCFSFYGNKVVTTGEGGMIVTNDAGIAAKLRILRAHGMAKPGDYRHEVLGFNYRLTNIQAALGVGQMERIEQILEAKKRIAHAYSEGLRDVPGIQLPPEADWATNIYWLYSVLVDANEFGMDRDELIAELALAGFETRPVFFPIHRQPLYADGRSRTVAEHISETGISLPSAATLRDDEVRRVTRCFTEIAARRGTQAVQT